MTSRYAYLSNIWPSVSILLLFVALAIYAWRRHRVSGALPFTIASLFAVLLATGSMMEYAATDWVTKLFWVKFQGIWTLPTVTAITCFSLEYAWPRRWLTRRNLTLLSIPCFLAAGLILTDNLHHLLWRSFIFQGSVQPQYGPIGWFFVAYVFGVLGTLNLVVFGWLFLHSPQQCWPVAVVMAGQFGGCLLFLAERANLLHSVLPLDLVGMSEYKLASMFPVASTSGSPRPNPPGQCPEDKPYHPLGRFIPQQLAWRSSPTRKAAPAQSVPC